MAVEGLTFAVVGESEAERLEVAAQLAERDPTLERGTLSVLGDSPLPALEPLELSLCLDGALVKEGLDLADDALDEPLVLRHFGRA